MGAKAKKVAKFLFEDPNPTDEVKCSSCEKVFTFKNGGMLTSGLEVLCPTCAKSNKKSSRVPRFGKRNDDKCTVCGGLVQPGKGRKHYSCK